MPRISVVINSYNERLQLEQCIDNLRGFADEIIVADMMSRDGSAEIVKRHGCVVLECLPAPLAEYTLVQRVQAASHEWILRVDVDNRLPAQTKARLLKVVENDEADVVEFYHRTFFLGKPLTHGHASGGYHVHFYKKAVFLKNGIPDVRIHSMEVTALRAATSRWLRLARQHYIDHLAYDDLFAFFKQHLRYALIEAKERHERGEAFSFLRMVKAFVQKVLTDFVYRSAWKDGIHSVIYSLTAEIMVLQTHFLLWDFQRNKRCTDIHELISDEKQ